MTQVLLNLTISCGNTAHTENIPGKSETEFYLCENNRFGLFPERVWKGKRFPVFIGALFYGSVYNKGFNSYFCIKTVSEFNMFTGPV